MLMELQLVVGIIRIGDHLIMYIGLNSQVCFNVSFQASLSQV